MPSLDVPTPDLVRVQSGPRDAWRAPAAAGVADKVTFRVGDLFAADVREATVVTLYLLPSMNARLAPMLPWVAGQWTSTILTTPGLSAVVRRGARLVQAERGWMVGITSS